MAIPSAHAANDGLNTLLRVAASAAVGNVSSTAEDNTAFLTRCKREVLAQSPDASRQVDSICGSQWDMVIASTPMAAALLAAAPAANARFSAATARSAMKAVRWNSKPAAGQVATGRMKDIGVGIATAPAATISLDWFKNGEPIPFDLPEALKSKGAQLTRMGCYALGAGEGGSAYRVTSPGKAPFSVMINFREAAVASQSSTYSAAADFSGRIPTLSNLVRDGNEWTASCSR